MPRILPFFLLLALSGLEPSTESETLVDEAAVLSTVRTVLGDSSSSNSNWMSLGDPKTVHLVTCIDTITPLLSDSLNGKTVWELVFDSVRLHLTRTTEAFQDAHPKTAVVIADSATGLPLRIELRESTATVSGRSVPPAHAIEARMSPPELVVGFLSSPPKVTLAEALNDTPGQPVNALTIVAWDLMYAVNGGEAKPIWLLYLMDMSPISLGNRDTLTAIRCVVDAESRTMTSVSDLP